jgi:hypothetical protein
MLRASELVMVLLDGTLKSDDCLYDFIKDVLQPQETEDEQVSYESDSIPFFQRVS